MHLHVSDSNAYFVWQINLKKALNSSTGLAALVAFCVTRSILLCSPTTMMNTTIVMKNKLDKVTHLPHLASTIPSPTIKSSTWMISASRSYWFFFWFNAASGFPLLLNHPFFASLKAARDMQSSERPTSASLKLRTTLIEEKLRFLSTRVSNFF